MIEKIIYGILYLISFLIFIGIGLWLLYYLTIWMTLVALFAGMMFLANSD
jgi:Na+/melibiose symporter-like transporter